MTNRYNTVINEDVDKDDLIMVDTKTGNICQLQIHAYICILFVSTSYLLFILTNIQVKSNRVLILLEQI